MKKVLVFVAVLALIAGFTSCKKTEYSSGDLIGRWQAPSDSKPNDAFQYRVFLADKDADGMYFGYEWDMGDHEGWDNSKGTYEDFLLTPKEKNGEFHGNGWYKWELQKDGKLTIYNAMSQGWGTIPKIYNVTVLTGTDLSMKDEFDKVFSFKKVQK